MSAIFDIFSHISRLFDEKNKYMTNAEYLIWQCDTSLHSAGPNWKLHYDLIWHFDETDYEMLSAYDVKGTEMSIRPTKSVSTKKWTLPSTKHFALTSANMPRIEQN